VSPPEWVEGPGRSPGSSGEVLAKRVPREWRLNVAMPYTEVTPGIRERLELFGRALRAARHRVHLTQMALEERSGVDQTLISRLERGRAAHAALDRVLALQDALGRDFPLGSCPHDHDCEYRVAGVEPAADRRFHWWEAFTSRGG
jgi:hypothetical protein